MIFSSFFSKVFSASLIIFSVSTGNLSLLDLISSSLSLAVSAESDIRRSPFETLSPILTFIFSTIPSSVEGTSTLDLSLSIVTTESFFFILSPDFTSISIISTFSKSPISGTIILLAILIFLKKLIKIK